MLKETSIQPSSSSYVIELTAMNTLGYLIPFAELSMSKVISVCDLAVIQAFCMTVLDLMLKQVKLKLRLPKNYFDMFRIFAFFLNSGNVKNNIFAWFL